MGNDARVMIDQYFPASMQKEMQEKMLAQYFSASQPPRVVSGEGDSADLLVQGTVTTVSRMGRNPQTLSTTPVALLLGFRHAEGIGSKIDKVTEVSPSTAEKAVPAKAQPAVSDHRESNPGDDQVGKAFENVTGQAVSQGAGKAAKKLVGIKIR